MYDARKKFIYGGNEWTLCVVQSDVVRYFFSLCWLVAVWLMACTVREARSRGGDCGRR